MIGNLLFSIVILIIGFAMDPTLSWLWYALAILVWLPFTIVFATLVLGLTWLIFV